MDEIAEGAGSLMEIAAAPNLTMDQRGELMRLASMLFRVCDARSPLGSPERERLEA